MGPWLGKSCRWSAVPVRQNGMGDGTYSCFFLLFLWESLLVRPLLFLMIVKRGQGFQSFASHSRHKRDGLFFLSLPCPRGAAVKLSAENLDFGPCSRPAQARQPACRGIGTGFFFGMTQFRDCVFTVRGILERRGGVTGFRVRFIFFRVGL